MIERLPLSAAGFESHPANAAEPGQGTGPDSPHILLILDGFPKSLGGGERIALRLAELFPRYGFRASVLAFSVHPESPVLSTPLPFPVYVLPLRRTWDLTAFRAAIELGRFLRQRDIRIVQTFFESSDLWGGLVTRALSPAKLIWSRRDMGILRSPIHARAYPLLRRLPDLVFAVSEQVRQHVIAVDHVSPTRVRTLYNGIDTARWCPSANSPQRNNLRVTTVGNLRRVKGHDLFIRAAALVLQQIPDASFSIVGQVLEPEYHAELQVLIAELGLDSRFALLANGSDLREHLASAGLFVLPSRSEGFSNAILEAMASSLPVIATNVGGNAEAVQHEVTGLIVPPDDPHALAQAMARLLSDPQAMHQMGLAGKQRVEQRFSTDVMMQELATACEELLFSLPDGSDPTPQVS
jgi:glycosyltransferase involved in cell wall biosynthesis